MALATTAAAIAGTTAAAAYLEAKFHVKRDVGTLWTLKSTERAVIKAAKSHRLSLWYHFEAQVHRLPSTEECIWSREGTYTWAETYAQCCRYAQFYLSLGIVPGELVAFYLTNSPDFLIAMMGSWAVGSAPANINYNLGGDALLHCLRVSGARVLLVDQDAECRGRIEEARERIEGELKMKIVVLDDEQKRTIGGLEAKRPADEYRKGVKPEFPMCLLYTSGSTGHPKACAFQTQRAWSLGDPFVRSLDLKVGPDGDRYYNCMPLYHGTGCCTAVSCMMTGITVCIGKKFSTSRFWEDIRDSQATAFVYVGETARYLLAVPESPLDKDHKVRLMWGNGLRPDVWRRFRERFGIDTTAEFFNSTEGVLGMVNVCRGDYLTNAVGHHGLLLRTLLHNQYVPVEIDHETGGIWRDPATGFARRKPYDEGGEIIVNVPNTAAFAGYWGNDKATTGKFERDVFKKGDLYYRSGDALRRTPDGRWFFMDRLGDTFRWKSENVSTAEVAEVLGHYPGVVEAIVYGVEVPGHDGRAGCAALYIPPAARPAFSFARLLAHARARLPRYAVPVFLRLAADMAPMHNNKQNKVPLKAEGVDPARVGAGASKDDRLLWCPEALGLQAAGEGYVEFRTEDWERLRGGAGGVAAKL